ncbi:cupin domain-containing protein [Sphingopyxis sp. OPL5]|uniref:cupin domain-containing protein n=1 Tax=Sphingopyxis sp. OPL5 TaxID=2486273 RepID=UPI00164D592A|nr:cupin domain-containing protein [Sphingopyxis sp. OPL5]QNO25452.1 cupin domain-containing protein [Sphingopyxis sp. OPL5]
MTDPRALIDKLQLAPHPEGGWYRETWRGPPGADGRASGTAIHFLLEAGQSSHWHKVDAEEIWLWHAGSSLTLSLAATDADTPALHRLGPDALAGEQPQIRVPAHHWQAAFAPHGWALVSCLVVPGFDFAGFTLAPPGWAPGSAPGG